jgi:anhydro-N-acetylmuramic acid kinase
MTAPDPAPGGGAPPAGDPTGRDSPDIYIGLMSGTSIDAVDGVAARFNASGGLEATLASASVPIPPELRQQLTRLQSPGEDELAAAARAANALTDLYADCTRALLARMALPALSVTALAAHGQTVRHQPGSGYTIQLMNGARLANATRIDTVCDLRSGDIAAGGQGAPLVPAFHAQVFRGAARRAIVNIGGIANVTILEPAGLAAATVTGYDTGPGNTLMDAWFEAHHDSGRFDVDGDWAKGGKAADDLLVRLLAEPYFSQPPPKSTGRDLFNIEWLQRHDPSGLTPVDVQATLLELTARTIAGSCAEAGVAEVYVCGGGAANRQLMSRLQAMLPVVSVATTAALGMDPQAVEATAFAWLARQRIREEPGNLPAVTGASGPRVLGAVYFSGGER